MFQWNQKMKVPEESGFSQKKTISTNNQRQKPDDLDFFENLATPLVLYKIRSSYFFHGKLRAKNKRMYIEVHFQRNTSQSIKKEAAAFRLKRNGEILEKLEYCQF